MIRKGVDTNRDWCGLSPIHLACCLMNKGDATMVRLLLQNKAAPCKPISFKQLMLLKSFFFSSFLNIPLRQKPFSKYCGPKSEPYENEVFFPVDFAASVKNLQIVQIISKYMLTISNYGTASHFLVVQQDLKISLELLVAGADMSQRNSDGSTALHLACRAGNLELAAVYIQLLISVDAFDFNNWTPLHEAASNGQQRVCKYLLKLGADPNLKNDCDETPT